MRGPLNYSRREHIYFTTSPRIENRVCHHSRYCGGGVFSFFSFPFFFFFFFIGTRAVVSAKIRNIMYTQLSAGEFRTEPARKTINKLLCYFISCPSSPDTRYRAETPTGTALVSPCRYRILTTLSCKSDPRRALPLAPPTTRCQIFAFAFNSIG